MNFEYWPMISPITVTFPLLSTTGASSVLELPASGQGTTTPGATFGQEVVTPTATLLPPVNTTFELVAVDASGNIYVGAQTTAPSPGSEILIYAPGATG